MSKFIVFAGEDYYPQGGAQDIVGISDHESFALEIAQEYILNTVLEGNLGEWKYEGWFHIYDTEKHKVVTDVRRGVTFVSNGNKVEKAEWKETIDWPLNIKEQLISE